MFEFTSKPISHDRTSHCPEPILDPSAYASDSAHKLWETLRRRSQDLAIWAAQPTLFYPTKTFGFFYIYYIAKFRAPSELELKKWSP